MKIDLDAIDRKYKKPLHKQLAEIIRGAIPREFIKPIQQGITEAMETGPLVRGRAAHRGHDRGNGPGRC